MQVSGIVKSPHGAGTGFGGLCSRERDRLFALSLERFLKTASEAVDYRIRLR
jgi:hypothetical protein